MFFTVYLAILKRYLFRNFSFSFQPCLWLSELMLEMFDFTNFKNLGYTLFCLSNFLLYACVDVPYVYVPDHAHTTGTNMESASFLISILGVLNCLGVVCLFYNFFFFYQGELLPVMSTPSFFLD